ncbi:MAG: Na+/H+ antiporter subunit E [Gammaproteobacteria bacterium]|nr:Na+/H+ antiporter subunit E [Gammaproteobacteria bacterium]MCP4473966.1 Na+/H+ antiporter subunit E [Gammaproteobacteria bacterium]
MNAIKRYIGKIAWLIYFVLYIIFEVVISSVRVSRDVLSPRLKISPGVLAIPLGTDTDVEITILANLVSYTPGTLTLDVSTDHRTLFVHTMFADEADAVRRAVQWHLERVILRILR